MTTLITGGSGYFGSLLAQSLLRRNKNLRAFDLVDATDRPDDVEFQQGDIRDYDAVMTACHQVDVVFHNVAQVPLAKSRKLFDSVNIQGTENMLRAALSCGVQKVIYTSSSAVFGIPPGNPVTEATQPRPGEAYGKAKYAGELLCKEYANKGLDVTIIRPRTILGHGRLGIFQILFEWIRTGFNVPVLGKGANRYQFIHAGDLAEACIAAAERRGFAIYNCGTDRFNTMREDLEALCIAAGTGSKVRSIPMTPAIWMMNATNWLRISPLGAYHALMYGRSFYFDISKAKKELGWNPRYSNQEMLIESYNWYLENRNSILTAPAGSHHRSVVKQGILGVMKWLI